MGNTHSDCITYYGMLIQSLVLEVEFLMCLARSTNRVTPTNIPCVDDAIATHVSQGGHLAPESSMVYGTDPTAEYPALHFVIVISGCSLLLNNCLKIFYVMEFSSSELFCH